MADSRVSKLAQLLVNYCVAVQPGETVMLRGNNTGLPLMRETYRYVLRAGGQPALVWIDDAFTQILLAEGNEEQLRYTDPAVKLLTESYDAYINISADANTRTLSNVEPARYRLFSESQAPLLQARMQRAAAGEMKWVTTRFPTAAYAQEADMSLDEYEDFVYTACLLDTEDPEAAWWEVSARQQKLVDYLAGKDQVRIEGPDINLRLSIAGRTFVNADGHRNMPSGEVYTGPVENSVEGWVRFSYPGIHSGREVQGIMLRFSEGRVVEATADKNEAFLRSTLDTDPGARYLGEFAIGTNNGITQFTKSTLFDEKIGGTIHMAVGNGYPETGSQNVSAVHWDMICDMRDGGKIWVDDVLFYDSGKFVLFE